MSKFFLPALLLSLAATGCPKTDQSVAPADAVTPASQPARPPTIDLQRMFADVLHLADDAMAGRDSRHADQIGAAARHIAASHESAGLEPIGGDYLVRFDLPVSSRPGDDQHFWVERQDASVHVPEESFVSVRGHTEGRPVLAPLSFVGKGQPKPKRVSGKVAVVLADPGGEPEALQARLQAVAQAGAAAIVLVPEDPEQILPEAEPLKEVADAVGLPLVVLRRDAADQMLTGGTSLTELGSRDPTLGGASVALTPEMEEITEPTPNVLAMLPGTDLAQEIVVLGAHYDHIGSEQDGVFCRDPSRGDTEDDAICNGADDNASGTAMVMELARALAEAGVQPRRTLVFAHFAGEELGLLGSEALVKNLPDAPPFSDGKIVAMLNMDMVGRYRPDPGLSIGAVKSSPAWRPVLESIDARGLQVVLDDEVNSRSDHASFYRQDIPVLFFFTGLHDDYHRTSDEPELIAQDAMKSIAQIVLDVTLRLADGEAVPFAAREQDGVTAQTH